MLESKITFTEDYKRGTHSSSEVLRSDQLKKSKCTPHLVMTVCSLVCGVLGAGAYVCVALLWVIPNDSSLKSHNASLNVLGAAVQATTALVAQHAIDGGVNRKADFVLSLMCSVLLTVFGLTTVCTVRLNDVGPVEPPMILSGSVYVSAVLITASGLFLLTNAILYILWKGDRIYSISS